VAALERIQGDVRPGPLGGDRLSARVEAQGVLIKGLLEATPDITVEELRLDLAERGHLFGEALGSESLVVIHS
jgi:hypothetical protein